MTTIHSTETVPLLRVMRERGIKVRELAWAVQCSETDISRYRNGLRPTRERAEKIADHLGLSVGELGW